MKNKATVEEIRERFDKDVERFSNLESGQVSTVDAPLSLELITESAKRVVPHAQSLLDVGCGAGNYTLKMLEKLPNLNCTLLDLSKPMLDKAKERVSAQTSGRVEILQEDIRAISFEDNKYDIILSGAALHHLRTDDEWQLVFTKLYNSLKKGGCLMISDLITQETDALAVYFEEKYGDYLTGIGGEEYKNNVFAYIEKEDTPKSLTYQLDLMKRIGFQYVEVLHKNICFAAYGGVK